MGHQLCLWTVDPQDWRGIAAHEVTRSVRDEMQAGGVAVLHLQAEGTVLALRDMITRVRARSLELDPLQRHAAATVEPLSGALYWLQPSGEVRTIGGADHGHPPTLSSGQRAVDLEVTASGRGYWVAAEDGGISPSATPNSGAGSGASAAALALVPDSSNAGYLIAGDDH